MCTEIARTDRELAENLLGAFGWASLGAVYGLFVGWIVGLVTLVRR